MNFEEVVGEVTLTPPQTEIGFAEMLDICEAIQEVIEEREALEFLCYLARRDGHGVVVQRRQGRIYNAYVTRYGRSGEVLILEMDRLYRW